MPYHPNVSISMGSTGILQQMKNSQSKENINLRSGKNLILNERISNSSEAIGINEQKCIQNHSS